MSSSKELFDRACRVIPGGVNSPVRAFRGVGGTPRFIERGEGPYIFDVEGKRYVDYVGSWGPLILGHRPQILSDAIKTAAEKGTSFGAPTLGEVELAELLCELVPSIQMIRLVNSGTEATMSAIRLARGFTGRDRILKFNGCYHGHADSFLVQAGSGVATLGIAGSPGVPESFAKLTSSVEFNDLSAVEEAIQSFGEGSFAAIIVEPVAGNMGLVLPEPGFLEGLRALCDRTGTVLIFDEVMTGFRVSLGGAAERFKVRPDLSTWGKVIGGGLPVGAFGGKREIMKLLAPEGPVYQAGTLSGNPLAVAAGLATLRSLVAENPYPVLEERTRTLAEGLKNEAGKYGIPLVSSSCGSMFGFYFSESKVRNFIEAKLCDAELFKKFFHAMLDQGVYLAPSAFEAGFVSTVHTDRIIDETIVAASKVFQVISQ